MVYQRRSKDQQAYFKYTGQELNLMTVVIVKWRDCHKKWEGWRRQFQGNEVWTLQEGYGPNLHHIGTAKSEAAWSIFDKPPVRDGLTVAFARRGNFNKPLTEESAGR